MPRTSVPTIPLPRPTDPLAPFRATLIAAAERPAEPRIVYDAWLDDPEGYLLGSCYGAAETGIALRSLLRAAGAWADVDPDDLCVDDDAGTVSLDGLPIGTFRIAPRLVTPCGWAA